MNYPTQQFIQSIITLLTLSFSPLLEIFIKESFPVVDALWGWKLPREFKHSWKWRQSLLAFASSKSPYLLETDRSSQKLWDLDSVEVDLSAFHDRSTLMMFLFGVSFFTKPFHNFKKVTSHQDLPFAVSGRLISIRRLAWTILIFSLNMRKSKKSRQLPYWEESRTIWSSPGRKMERMLSSND